MKIGDRARFTGVDKAYHGKLNGRVGKVVGMPGLDQPIREGICVYFDCFGDGSVAVVEVGSLTVL